MDETPLPFDSKSAKDYRKLGKEFREKVKVDVNGESETIQVMKEKSTNNLCKYTEIDDDIILK